MTDNSYNPSPSSPLSKKQKGEIQNSSNPAIQLIGGIVGLQESLKTFITSQKIDSSIISADHRVWSRRDRSQH